jgi:aconitate hydratase
MYLGVKAVVAKSFSRIHHANLVNMGILPLVFADEADYDGVELGDAWAITGLHAALRAGQDLTVQNLTRGGALTLTYDLTERQVAIILAGGLLNRIGASA